MRLPPTQVLLFILALSVLLAFIQVGILTIAFEKLGLSTHSAFLLLFSSLFGSGINLPLMKIDAEKPSLEGIPERMRALIEINLRRFTGKTQIAINVGGCLIPLMFSYYLIQYNSLPLTEVIPATAIVGFICYLASRPIPGLGIAMPIFIAPITAAIVAYSINPEHSAPLAYICGTLGVLIGADLMRLKDIRKMGAPIASIGGAGTFDGIFMTGIVAVLLA